MNSLTENNGLLIITVPDITAPAMNELPFQEFSREHINYFTEVSLSNLLLKYGYNVIQTKRASGEIIGYFKKNNTNEYKLQNDIIGKRSILKYIDKSKEYENIIYSNISKYRDIPIIIWGLGTFTQRFLLKNLLKDIIAIVDSNPQYRGKKYEKINIISPEELIRYNEPIILALSSRYIDAVKMKIKNLNLTNEIILIQ